MNEGYHQASLDKKSSMSRKMSPTYTMNAVTPKSKSRGEKYTQAGGKVNLPNVTMNASRPAARTGEKPEQAYTKKKQRGTMSGTNKGGERAEQADPKGNFSSGYSQHGK